MDSTLKISRFAACLQVFSLTLRRQFFSRQTIVVGVLLLLALVITIIWAIPWPWSPEPRTGEQLAGLMTGHLPFYDNIITSFLATQKS